MHSTKFFLVLLFLTGLLPVFAQTPRAEERPLNPSPSRQDTNERRAIRQNNRAADKADRIRNEALNAHEPPKRKLSNEENPYRSATLEEALRISTDLALLKENETFLNLPNTGITKLVVVGECKNKIYIIDAREECLQFDLPGYGESFSFRRNSYVFDRIADIVLEKDSFSSSKVFNQALYSNLGKIDLGQIDNRNASYLAMGSVLPFKKVQEYNEWAAKGNTATSGYNGQFPSKVRFKVGDTILFRNIAYRGELFREYKGVIVSETESDTRKDIIVAFNILSVDVDGSTTILWKVLSSKKSPELKP